MFSLFQVAQWLCLAHSTITPQEFPKPRHEETLRKKVKEKVAISAPTCPVGTPLLINKAHTDHLDQQFLTSGCDPFEGQTTLSQGVA